MKLSRFLIFTTSFIPLFWLNSLIFPFVTSKALVFFFLVEFICIALILYAPKKITLQMGVLEIAFSLLIVFLGLATIFSNNAYISFWGTMERMTGVILWIHVLFFLFAIRSVFNEKCYYVFFKYSFIASSIIAFLALGQRNEISALANSEGRVDVLFGNPVFLSAYLLLSIGFGLILFVRAQQAFSKWIIAFCVWMHIVALFYAGTRGSILGLLAAIFVGCLVYAFSGSASKKLKYFAIGGGVAVLLMVGGIVAFNDHPFFSSHPILERFSAISNIKEQTRYYLWEAAIDGIGKHPIFGVGLEGYGDVFDVYREPTYFGKDAITSLAESWSDRAHNAFLDMGVGGGVPVALLFLGIFCCVCFVLYTTKHLRDSERSILIGVVAGYGVHSLFTFNMLVDLMLFTVIVAFVSQFDTKRFTYELKPNVVFPLKIGVCVLIILAVVSTGNRFVFAHQMRLMLSKTDNGTTEEFEGHVELSQKRFLDRPYIYKELPFVGLTVLASQNVNANDLEDMSEEVLAAENSLRTHNQLEIKDRYYFGAFYRNAGMHEDSLRVLKEAVDLAPSNQLMLMEYGKSLAASGGVENALGVLEDAYNLEPTNDEAVKTYARVLLQANRTDEANKVIQTFYGEDVTAIEMLSVPQ